jgi:Uma2 family endonuclease
MVLPQQYLPALSAEQYLDLERLSEMRHEFLDGLMYAMAGESRDHSRICYNLAGITHAKLNDTNCEGFSPNMKVRTGIGDLYAYPDLMIVCGEARFHDDKGDVLLNPTVIFEVLSPSTEKYDRGEKSLRYRTQIESLQDYVLVSQDKAQVEHHHRESDGTWTSNTVSGPENVLTLGSIDCNVPLAEIYRNTRVSA